MGFLPSPRFSPLFSLFCSALLRTHVRGLGVVVSDRLLLFRVVFLFLSSCISTQSHMLYKPYLRRRRPLPLPTSTEPFVVSVVTVNSSGPGVGYPGPQRHHHQRLRQAIVPSRLPSATYISRFEGVVTFINPPFHNLRGVNSICGAEYVHLPSFFHSVHTRCQSPHISLMMLVADEQRIRLRDRLLSRLL